MYCGRADTECDSLARVSKKREYFKCRPKTIGDFAPKLFKLEVPRNWEYRDRHAIYKRPQMAATYRICRLTISS
jgi:hypothetical protein